jgi:probable addiction module antidote protein
MPKTKSSAKTKTVSYDVAEQQRTPEEMAEYLDAWVTEAPEDASGIARPLGDISRAKGMSQIALDAKALAAKACTRHSVRTATRALQP